MADPKRPNIVIVKEGQNYFPIFKIVMNKGPVKSFKYQQTFNYENKKDNIINHLYDFYLKNIDMALFLDTNTKLMAKTVYHILDGLKIQEYRPRFQIIDARNKCKYIITYNGTIIPVNPSGARYGGQIWKNRDLKILPFNETLNKLNELYGKLTDKIPIKPIGVYYDHKSQDEVNVIGIMIQSRNITPTKPEKIPVDKLNKMGLLYEYKQLQDKVDILLEKEDAVPKKGSNKDKRIKKNTLNK